MGVAFFSAQSYETAAFNEVLQRSRYRELSLTYLESRLSLYIAHAKTSATQDRKKAL